MFRNFAWCPYDGRVAVMAAAFVVGLSLYPIASRAFEQNQSKMASSQASKQLVFSSPEAALKSLLLAFEKGGDKALLDIFGHEHAKLIVVTDRIARDEGLARLCEAARQKTTWLNEGEGKRILILGDKAWPFPIPLGRVEGGWQFDTIQGADEIIDRRIGANELGAIDSCLAYVGAQAEYATIDRDEDGVLEYAQRLGSTEGRKDGLYWYVDPEGDEELSPFGPLLADAVTFLAEARKTDGAGLPFHGYYYRILTAQGAHPPGGEYSYIINGNMIAGCALVGFPADYGSSGIMTFLVSHQGKLYEKDLGAETHVIAKSLSRYNPDSTWRIVEAR